MSDFKPIKKITHIIPAEYQGILGKSETEWTIDGNKINCGRCITVFFGNHEVSGRFEIGDDSKPYLAGTGQKITEGLLAKFKES